MKQQIDLEKSMIVATLPNGDLYRVRSERQKEEVLKQLPKLPGRRIAGAMDCPYCLAPFMSLSARDEHIRSAHGVASGSADARAVELPDGRIVPLELVVNEYMASEQRAMSLAAEAAREAAEEE